jgi:hypothetical protein
VATAAVREDGQTPFRLLSFHLSDLLGPRASSGSRPAAAGIQPESNRRANRRRAAALPGFGRLHADLALGEGKAWAPANAAARHVAPSRAH